MKELKNALLIFIVLSVLCGIIYPFLMTGIAQIFFPKQANGSLITVNETVIGSELIGQTFTSARYFQGRPSAISYDAGTSGGSNLGPLNPKLLEQVGENLKQVRTANGLAVNSEVPGELVLASASGLDPHISVEAALLQVERVAQARGLAKEKIQELVQSSIEKPVVSFWGQPYVNVLKLNLALDALGL